MQLSSTQKRILQELEKEPRTSKQLTKIIDSKESTIRARISEIRKKGYNVKVQNGVYSLEQNPVLELIDRKRMYHKPITKAFLITFLQSNNTKVEGYLLEAIKKKRSIQLSNDVVQFLPPQ